MSEARSEEREQAKFASRGCEVCGGAGMVIVFHHAWTGSRLAKVQAERNGEIVEQEVAAEVSAHCICALGRWMRSKSTEAVKARVPDGAAILVGHSNFSFQPPGSDPDERFEAPTRAAIARRFGKVPGAF